MSKPLSLSPLSLSSDPPGRCRAPKITNVTKTTMTVTWTAPDNDGGSPVTGYHVERHEPFAVKWTRITPQAIPHPQFTSTDLIEGTKYEFRVLAENKAGVGPPSDPSESMVAKAPYGKYGFWDRL